MLYSWFLNHKTRWRLLVSLLRSTWPRRTPSKGPTACCTHSCDSTREREFDSNVSYFLILIKACSILVCTHFTRFFRPFTLIGDKWEDKYAPFEPKSFEVHPTNSQCVPFPMMGFEYVNGLPLIHKGPLWPSAGIVAHLVVSGLLIRPFSVKDLTHTKRDLRSHQKEGTLYISCFFNHIFCFHLILKEK